MTQSARNMLAVNARRFAPLAPVAVGGAASAQTTGPVVSGLDLTGPIGTFGTNMTSTITTNSPALFGILALSVGFFFLWGRVRALF